MITKCSFEIFYLYRELHTYYSVIYFKYIFRYNLPIQIACRCVDRWSTSVAATQLSRSASLSYQDTRCLYSWKMKNYKSLQAHKYFLSRCDQNVIYVILSSGNVLLMCDIGPSYRTSDKPDKPWTAWIWLCHCTCMTGYVFF